MARDPKAQIEISAHSRNLGAHLREARAKFGKFGGELKRHVFGKDLVEKGFWSKAGASMVGNMGSNIAGAAAGFYANQAKEAYQFSDALTRLQITANQTPEEMDAFAKTVRAASDATGISKSEIMGAARQYVALTGDMDGATKASGMFARVAQASESSIADVASTAQAMRDNLKIDPSDFEAGFGALITQGKLGAVEIKDLAGLMAQISPLGAQFGGGTGLGGLRELGASLQVVRKGFGSAEESVTGMQSLMVALIKNGGRFQKAGVQVFDKDPKTGVKTLKSFNQVIGAIAESKLMKDPTKLEKAFGRVEAYRAFLQLKDNKTMLDDLIAKSSDAGVVQRDLDTYLASTAGKTKRSWEQVKNEIAEAFTPERIENFANIAMKLAKSLGLVAGAVSTALGVASAVGEAAAAWWGGESEEDRISKLKSKRNDERKLILRKQILAENPQLSLLTDTDQVESMVSGRMGQEDAMRDAIAGGKRMSNFYQPDARVTRLDRDKAGEYYVSERVAPGTGRRVREDQGYSIDELVAKKRQLGGSGNSDAAMTAAIIDAAIAKQTAALASLTAVIRAFGVSGPPVELKLNGDKIADANRNARNISTRPGR